MAARTRKPKSMGPNGSDHFQTPPEALEPLLPYLPKTWAVWEPACGKGNLVRAFAGHGYRVFASDRHIVHPEGYREGVVWYGERDFLTWQPQTFGWDCLITNPPYSIKAKFLERAYALGKPWAFLLPISALCPQRNQEFLRRAGVQILIPRKRIDFETPTQKKDGKSWFDTVWFCSGLNLPRDLCYEEPLQLTLGVG